MSNITVLFILCYLTVNSWFLFLEWLNYRFQNQKKSLKKVSDLFDISQQNIDKCLQYSNNTFVFDLIITIIGMSTFVGFVYVGGFGYIEKTMLFLSFNLNSVIFQGFVFFILWNILSTFIPKLITNYYRNYFFKKKHGFEISDRGVYIKSVMISLGMSVIVNSLIASLLVGLIAYFPDNWWFGFLVLTSFLLFCKFLINPLLIEHFIKKTTPLEQGVLRQNILKIVEKSGITFSDIRIKKDKKSIFCIGGRCALPTGEAKTVGFGSSKKIICNEYLVKNTKKTESMIITAREIGYYVHKHIYWKFFAGLLLTVFIVPLVYILTRNPSITEDFGFEKINAYSICLLLYIILDILQLVTKPIINGINQYLEYQADNYAVKLTSAQDIIDCLKQVYVFNNTIPILHPLYSLFHQSTPDIFDRINRLHK